MNERRVGQHPVLPPAEGEPNCVLDMGTHSALDVGYDPTADLPLALGDEEIVITNNGTQTMFAAVTLTDDGIPEDGETYTVGPMLTFDPKTERHTGEHAAQALDQL